jgi:hypothetical protein
LLLLSSCIQKEAVSSQEGTIVVNYSFEGIKKGFNHLTKTEITLIINWQPFPLSIKSQKNSISITAPKGEHLIEIVNLANYKGQWERHTKENKYNQDCFYEGQINLDKKLIINVLFDLNKGTSVSFRQK